MITIMKKCYDSNYDYHHNPGRRPGPPRRRRASPTPRQPRAPVYVYYIYIYIYIHTYIHTYIHINIHTYMHTYIHAYIHTYIHEYI